MIEFDVDMNYLLEEGELDKIVLTDEFGGHEPMTFWPGSGELSAAIEHLRQAVRDAFSRESVSMLVEGNAIMRAIDDVEAAAGMKAMRNDGLLR